MKSNKIGEDSISNVYDIGEGKVIKIARDGQNLEREAKIQNKLSDISPKIFTYRDNWIIMEKMDGTLYDIIKTHIHDKPLFNMLIKSAKRDVRCAIRKMHERSIIHNDMKSSNIFYKIIDNQYKFYIGDFGMAQKSKKDLTDKNVLLKLMLKRWGDSDNIKFAVNEIFNTIRYEFEIEPTISQSSENI
tara:strand:+ start:818 stop:1381 length:564 start_codon:yes stop_codon:yes gene_type:complete